MGHILGAYNNLYPKRRYPIFLNGVFIKGKIRALIREPYNNSGVLISGIDSISFYIILSPFFMGLRIISVTREPITGDHMPIPYHPQ